MSAADALVRPLPRTTLVVGKGGVGKTTTAAAIAMHAATLVGQTLVLSTDPARALPAVLEHPIQSEPTPVPYAKRLTAQVLDAGVLRSRFMARWGDVIRTILDRGTYLDDSDIGPLVDTALPGGDEIFSALALAVLLAQDRPYERIVVDTAPTGHTLRLLTLPQTFRALVQLLQAMQAKHVFMVKTLTRQYRKDEADRFLNEMAALVTALEEAFRNPKRCVAVMVTNPQPLVVEETRRYLAALSELPIRVAAVVWNATDGAVAPLGGGAVAQFVVPKLDRWPTGKEGLERWLAELRPLAAGQAGQRSEPGTHARGKRKARDSALAAPSVAKKHPASLDTLLRSLTIVAGKGGVGKTTVAATLALWAADRKRTLVVSTDPAPSLADALGQPVPDADTPVYGVANLAARQMDASAAFARMREEYQSRVDALFEGLVAKGVDLSHDRRIARDLLSLAPPGVDEVYALSLLSDALFQDHYGCVVVDPAPTGHLLRLLEMPQLALAWTHQLMRLMLKYRDVGGLGDTAREILQFSKSLRAVDALLHDAHKCAVVLVTLDEPVVRDETERLAVEVRRRGVASSGVVLNRATKAAPLPVTDAPVHFQAPLADPPPVGPQALRRWGNSWVTSDE
ncbi:MAG: ArsA family ATPase [Gemmatimonadaceae bacterium]